MLYFGCQRFWHINVKLLEQHRAATPVGEIYLNPTMRAVIIDRRAKIGRVMPLCEAAVAHRLQEENTLHKSGTLAGKIVLEV